MPLVIVKPKFQVTIPAKLRRSIDLHEGDLLETTITGDGILSGRSSGACLKTRTTSSLP